jgi:hypothetical protein
VTINTGGHEQRQERLQRLKRRLFAILKFMQRSELRRDVFEEFQAENRRHGHLLGLLGLNSTFTGAYMQRDAPKNKMALHCYVN